ncbi:MAG: (d)CMP kinase [Rikenellaceae bacterium]
MKKITRDIIIAIDGYSSCGKSTFAKAIAARLGYIFIDTGAMYRAITLSALRGGGITNGVLNREAVEEMLPGIELSFQFNPQRGASDIYVNGECVEGDIRGLEVSQFVSHVSSIPQVREKLTLIQQQMGRRDGVVMDGRDIGTAVFPAAEFKIFMTAQSSVRAERRYLELKGKGEDVRLEDIERNIVERDLADESREVSPLRRADDAVVLDNSFMSPAEQMEWFDEHFAKVING